MPILCDSAEQVLKREIFMEDRYSERVPVECSVVFAGDSIIGEGRVVDVSLPGCLMESPESAKVGDYVRLKLFLPDCQPAVSVPLAVVRWAKGGRLGIEFIRSSKEDQIRLKRFVCRRRQRASVSEWEAGVEILSAIGD
jgi:hypothetical protein